MERVERWAIVAVICVVIMVCAAGILVILIIR